MAADRQLLATAGKLAYVVLLLAMAAIGTVAMVGGPLEDVRLDGAEPAATMPKLDLANVRHETFQKGATAWFDQHWGLRGYAVRTDNTIGVRVFGEVRTDQQPAIGNDGVLFTRDDLTYVNRTDAPDATIALAKQFARVQTKLRARGKVLLPILIPSKTSFHRDSVPASWRRPGAFGRSDENLYRAFVRTLADSGALFVDARALLTAETKRPEDVFQKPARHWRRSSSCRALQAAIDVVRPEIPELGNEQIDCQATLDPATPLISTEFDIHRLLNTWGAKPEGVDVDRYSGRKSSDALRVPTLFVGSSFVWSFVHVSRELETLTPSLCYYYDESVTDTKTLLVTKKVAPFTDDWREDTFGKRLFIVGVLETFLPGDGKKFLDEIEKELDSSSNR